MTDEVKTPREDGESKPPLTQRIVAFEIVADGFKLIRNDCASMLELRGLIEAAGEIFKKKP